MEGWRMSLRRHAAWMVKNTGTPSFLSDISPPYPCTHEATGDGVEHAMKLQGACVCVCGCVWLNISALGNSA